MIIECATCPVRGQRCDDCMVTAVAALAPAPVSVLTSGADLMLDRRESAAVTNLVAAGLISLSEASLLQAQIEPWTGSRSAS